MINHARTLLLNIDGSTYQPQHLGEEYIPATFKAVPLPSYIQAARRILFGSKPERTFLNYRVRELLHTIHETELAEYVYALDPRVTYWPETSPVFFNTQKQLRLTQTDGVRGAKLFVTGAPRADHVYGVANRSYRVRVDKDIDDEHYMTIAYEDGTRTRTQIDVSTGLSSPVSIRDTDMTLRVGGKVRYKKSITMETGYPLYTEELEELLTESGNVYDDYPEESSASLGASTLSVFDGSAWELSIFTPPDSVVSVVPLLEVLGAANLVELFGTDANAQPITTFKNLWADHPSFTYRLAAFTLAVIYRTEEIRRARNG